MTKPQSLRLRLPLTLRFFLLFWVSASAITLATYVGTRVWADQTNLNDELTHRITRLAERAVDYYERHGTLPTSDRLQEKRRQASRQQAPRQQTLRQQALRQQALRQQESRRQARAQRDAKYVVSIQASDNTYIIAPPAVLPQNTFTIDITSQSNQHYLVTAKHPRILSTMQTIARAISMRQLVVILIASALASAILGWYVARPIRNLGLYSQRRGDQPNLALPANITNRNDEIGDLGASIDAMATQLEHAAMHQTHLLHDVSHELRAPLARLQAMLGLMEQQGGEPSQYQQMHQELDAINQLIASILELNQNHSRINQQALDVISLIDKVVANLATEAPLRQVRVMAPSQLQGIGNSQLLYRALENLIRNAHKYSPIDLPIVINVQAHDKRITIDIIDQGPGIEEQELDKITQPFYRSGNQMHTDGFGLGLSIVERSLAAIGGKLTLENGQQGGLRASVTLRQ